MKISALERYTPNNAHSFAAGSSYNAHAQWRGAKSVVQNLKRLTYRHIDIAEILQQFLGHDSVRKKRRPKKVHRWRVVRLPREQRMCRRRGPCSQTEWSEW